MSVVIVIFTAPVSQGCPGTHIVYAKVSIPEESWAVYKTTPCLINSAVPFFKYSLSNVTFAEVVIWSFLNKSIKVLPPGKTITY